ncbi:ABC transporter ATP-binding protein [Clostridium sp. 'deep sea']|uniref:ABC transporter ATP-binding protein n=1 Tax=Clostridium sp. 'deep sea' TaxID=2779445 RepID=UPI0018968796|nr:ABC transporter ATP-binding protein [Clostridium sp. 'deep sea']QOR36091.1 ABC transporter ATP-binding protein [Clostridium sp. 'deep sea']
MNKILEVKDLRISFNTYAGEIRAVRGVGFDLKKRETLAFVGESGCGKTVTAKSIMRLLKESVAEIKDGSKILYNGENVLEMNKKRLQEYRGNEVSMIFQDPMSSLNPTMTCGKQVMESLILHRNLNKDEARKEALKMFHLVRIPDAEKRLDSYPHQLSGGMRQRVMIAIALACNPSVLIADEPTTALDVTIQAQIMDLLSELKEELNMSIILVSHDLGVVANFADKIQVMYAGQVVERGNAKEIFYNPKHPYTWALLSSIPKLAKSRQELYALKGTPPDLILPLNHCPFADRCQYCMKICREQMPIETVLTDNHRLSCWLMHPSAPNVEPLYKKENI